MSNQGEQRSILTVALLMLSVGLLLCLGNGEKPIVFLFRWFCLITGALIGAYAAMLRWRPEWASTLVRLLGDEEKDARASLPKRRKSTPVVASASRENFHAELWIFGILSLVLVFATFTTELRPRFKFILGLVSTCPAAFAWAAARKLDIGSHSAAITCLNYARLSLVLAGFLLIVVVAGEIVNEVGGSMRVIFRDKSN